ncbi:MAG: cyclodeaminase/cyclohydrolase family protein [Prevotellaceae bacterium]|jgi:formiminotetrahydrofolate cyclodeaminase|nr:cyclodeaminase/cyclohydrolase family protein [Prevotellaceae bacterium]
MYSEKKIKDYLDDLSSNAHIPGGGSCVPLLGALANSVACFVLNLSVNRKKYAHLKEKLVAVREKTEKLQSGFLPLIDRDNEILEQILSACKNPEIAEPEMNRIIENAISFSLQICEMCIESLKAGLEIANIGNRMLSSDVEIIAYIGDAALNSSISNIKINIGSLKDEEYRKTVRDKCLSLRTEGENLKRKIIETVDLNI